MANTPTGRAYDQAVVAYSIDPLLVSAANPLPVSSADALLMGVQDGSGHVQPLSAIRNVTLAASAARTAAFQSADQVNYRHRGLLLFMNITAASGTGGLKPSLLLKDQLSGVYFLLWQNGTFQTGTGFFTWAFYPGASGGAISVGSVGFLNSIWAVAVAVGDATSYTYSISADVLI